MGEEIEVLPKSRVIDVTFQVVLPEAATMEEIDQWISLVLGCGSADKGNPLIRHSLTVHGGPDLEDSGLHRHERAEPNGRGGHRLIYTLQPFPYNGPRAIDVALAASMPKPA